MLFLLWLIILGFLPLTLVDDTSVVISSRTTRSGYTFGYFIIPTRSVQELVNEVAEDFRDFVDEPAVDPPPNDAPELDPPGLSAPRKATPSPAPFLPTFPARKRPTPHPSKPPSGAFTFVAAWPTSSASASSASAPHTSARKSGSKTPSNSLSKKAPASAKAANSSSSSSTAPVLGKRRRATQDSAAQKTP
ncbi:hypothetical protein EV360DRAFT_77367, partial [Lentinula raphanica]